MYAHAFFKPGKMCKPYYFYVKVSMNIGENSPKFWDNLTNGNYWMQIILFVSSNMAKIKAV